MLTKEKVLQMIKAMPEESFEDIDVLLERLVILEKVERGLQDANEGNVVQNKEAKNEIDSWFK